MSFIHFGLIADIYPQTLRFHEINSHTVSTLSTRGGLQIMKTKKKLSKKKKKRFHIQRERLTRTTSASRIQCSRARSTYSAPRTVTNLYFLHLLTNYSRACVCVYRILVYNTMHSWKKKKNTLTGLMRNNKNKKTLPLVDDVQSRLKSRVSLFLKKLYLQRKKNWVAYT